MLGNIWLGMAAALAFAGTAAAQAPSLDLRPFVAREISPQVRLLAVPEKYYGPAVSNISIIEQKNGFVVIDSGQTAGNGRKVVDYIRSFSKKPVKAVVFTHWHNDHPQGVSSIREAWPKVRIIATPQTKAGLQGPALDPLVGFEPTEAQYQLVVKQMAEQQAEFDKLLADPSTAPDRRERVIQAKKDVDVLVAGYRGTHITLPNELFTSERLIDDPVAPVRLLYLGRANTDGDAVAWLPKQKIVMSGDIVVSPIPFGFGSYPADWITTLGKLKALGFKTLIPGHGEPMQDTSYIDKLIASITTIREKVGPAAKAGMSFKDVKAKVDLSSEIDRFGTTARLKSGVPGLWTDPMRINAYKEAKGIEIKQLGISEPEPE